VTKVVHLKYGPLANAGTDWSARDDCDLLDFDAQRFPLAVIVETLGRTPHEILWRLQQLKAEPLFRGSSRLRSAGASPRNARNFLNW
jgi:hypothetical protein